MGVNDCVGGDISMNFDSIGPHKELNADDIKAGKKILNGLRYSSMVKQPHNGHRDFRETELGTVFTFQQSDYTNSLPVNLSGDIPCLVNGKMDKGIKSIGGVEDVEERRSRPRLRNLKLDIPNPVVPSFDVNKEHISGDSISRVSDTIAKFDTTPSPKHFIPIVNKRRSRSLSPCVPSPASLKSPTIRPVSPRIQHLCSRFSGEENILPECQKLMDYTEKIDQHSSSDISSVTRDMGMPHSFISNEQKSSSEVSENQNSWALPVGQSNTSTSNNVNLRNCLSPCISPSSGYGSGRYSSSPVNLSPRCHSPVAHSTECHDGLSQSMHTKASRTHSVDSGHHSTNLDTSDFQLPEMFDRNIKSPISQNFMDSSSRRSKLLSRSSHVFDSTELDVPEPLIYRPSSPVDEGFEEGNKSVKTSSVNSSNKIKRTQLTVRLKNIGPASPDLLGSSLKTMALSPKPRLCETSNNTVWSSASFSSMEMLPSPPAVIVTDDYGVSQDKGIFPSNSSVDQNSVGVAIDVPQIDILPADDLKSPKKSLLNRKLSNTSTCSSFSLDESEQEDNNEDCQIPTTGQKKRLMQWKKIRTLVHWSPFVQSYKRRYPWVQLAGHQGNFECAEDGDILKKHCPREQEALQALMNDVLRPYIPKYKGEAEKNGEKYIQMQDLLLDFENPCVMDCKLGTRTYIEEELKKAREKPKLRKDMYQKMIEIDPDEPTEEERAQEAIIKPRYMQWRENVSSSASLGFRIEGIKKADGTSSRNFKTTKDRQEIQEHFTSFADADRKTAEKYVSTLKAIRATLESSTFFALHEVIGSSLLFIHDKSGKTGIWIIDFGKTIPLPDSLTNDHRTPWIEGNHEDGYLFGVDNLINIWTSVCESLPSNDSSSSSSV